MLSFLIPPGVVRGGMSLFHSTQIRRRRNAFFAPFGTAEPPPVAGPREKRLSRKASARSLTGLSRVTGGSTRGGAVSRSLTGGGVSAFRASPTGGVPRNTSTAPPLRPSVFTLGGSIVFVAG